MSLKQAVSSGDTAAIKQQVNQINANELSIESEDFELLLSLLDSDDDWLVFDVCNLIEKVAKKNSSILNNQQFVNYLTIGLRIKNGKVVKMVLAILTHWIEQEQVDWLLKNYSLLDELIAFYVKDENSEMAFDLLTHLFKPDWPITQLVVDKLLACNSENEFQMLRLLRLFGVAMSNEIGYKRNEVVGEFFKAFEQSLMSEDELVLVNIIEIVTKSCTSDSVFDAFLSGNVVQHIAYGLQSEAEVISISALAFFVQCSSIAHLDFYSVFIHFELNKFLAILLSEEEVSLHKKEKTVYAVGKFIEREPNFDLILHEFPQYFAFIDHVIEIVNGGAGDLRIAAFYSCCSIFHKSFGFAGNTELKRILDKLDVSAFLANCKCFNNDQAVAANELLLAILKTSVGMQWFLKEGSVEKYVLDDGYNPNIQNMLEYLDTNEQAQQMLSLDKKERIKTVRGGTRMPARAAVSSEFQ